MVDENKIVPETPKEESKVETPKKRGRGRPKGSLGKKKREALQPKNK